MSKSKYFPIATGDVLAAAVCAFRMFGNKVVKDTPLSNKNSLVDHFMGRKALPITPEDQAMASVIVLGLSQQIVMLELTSRPVSLFLQEINQLCQEQEISSMHLGRMAWAPKLHDDIIKNNSVRELIQGIGIGGSYIGSARSKIELDFVPIEHRYVPDYNSWVHYGHDTHGNLVSFWRGEPITEAARISARVKTHRLDSRYSNVKVTVLNYVKVL